MNKEFSGSDLIYIIIREYVSILHVGMAPKQMATRTF